jgi:hypothetical protein
MHNRTGIAGWGIHRVCRRAAYYGVGGNGRRLRWFACRATRQTDPPCRPTTSLPCNWPVLKLASLPTRVLQGGGVDSAISSTWRSSAVSRSPRLPPELDAPPRQLRVRDCRPVSAQSLSNPRPYRSALQRTCEGCSPRQERRASKGRALRCGWAAVTSRLGPQAWKQFEGAIAHDIRSLRAGQLGVRGDRRHARTEVPLKFQHCMQHSLT